MPIYLEETIAVIESLQAFGARLIAKFDCNTPSSELLLEVEEWASKIETLSKLLPEGLSLGEWTRKVHFTRLFLKKNEPEFCRGDVVAFFEETLPKAMRDLRSWGGTLGYFDAELRAAVVHLVRIRDFSSAIRAAFVVLTQRLRRNYNLSGSLDGPALINEIFGSRSTRKTDIEEKDRQAIRDYLSGMYGVLRNKYAHDNPALDLTELEAALSSVNLALKLIEPVR